jgi:hypothetical protein
VGHPQQGPVHGVPAPSGRITPESIRWLSIVNQSLFAVRMTKPAPPTRFAWVRARLEPAPSSRSASGSGSAWPADVFARREGADPRASRSSGTRSFARPSRAPRRNPGRR